MACRWLKEIRAFSWEVLHQASVPHHSKLVDKETEPFCHFSVLEWTLLNREPDLQIIIRHRWYLAFLVIWCWWWMLFLSGARRGRHRWGCAGLSSRKESVWRPRYNFKMCQLESCMIAIDNQSSEHFHTKGISTFQNNLAQDIFLDRECLLSRFDAWN